MAKAAKPKARAPLVVCTYGEFVIVYFSREVIAERETFRRLSHRVVDLLVDRGQHESLVVSAASILSRMGRDQVIKMVTEFVHEAWADDS